MEIKPDFDFVRWFREFDAAAVRFSKAEATINLAPGHGIAVAMGAVVASRRGVPCIIYVEVDDGFHFAAPGVVAQLGSLTESDKKVLEGLRETPHTVQALSEKKKLPLSTTIADYADEIESGFHQLTGRFVSTIAGQFFFSLDAMGAPKRTCTIGSRG